MGKVTAIKRGEKWQWRFEGALVNGRRKPHTHCGYATKKEALIAGNEAYAEYNRTGLHFKPSEISVSDFLDKWFDLYCKVNLAETTQASYRKYIKLYIKPALGEYKLKAITPSNLQQLINDLFNGGMSRNTLTCVKGILTRSFTYAVEPSKLIQQSPAVYVKLPLVSAKPKKPQTLRPHSYLSKEQIDKIFTRFPLGSTAYLPLLLGYKCGMRLGEAFAVTWGDVDLDNGTIDINKQLQYSNAKKVWYLTDPKYKSCRTVDIDSNLADTLRAVKAMQDDNKVRYGELYTTLFEQEYTRDISTSGDTVADFINIRENGEFIQPRIMQHTSTVIQQQLGITEFTFHSLRHTHASILLENHCDAKYVQKRLGHKNIQETVNIYQHLTQSIRDENKQKLDDIF